MKTGVLIQIRKFAQSEYEQSGDSQHDFRHADRVASYCESIVRVLKLVNKVDGRLLTAASYLHDIVSARKIMKNDLLNHIFEKSLNKKLITKILDNFDLTMTEKRVLKNSIVNHPHSIPYRILNKHNDLYSKILQDADSLDYVSPIREKSFLDKSGRLIQKLTTVYMTYIRKNLKSYLNFPEILSKLELDGLTAGHVNKT